MFSIAFSLLSPYPLQSVYQKKAKKTSVFWRVFLHLMEQDCKARFVTVKVVIQSPCLLSIAQMVRKVVVDMKKSKPISIRLSTEALLKCNEAEQSGYSRTDFINHAILNVPIHNKVTGKELLPYFCEMQSIVEKMKNGSTKERLREELESVCQLLRYPTDNI